MSCRAAIPDARALRETVAAMAGEFFQAPVTPWLEAAIALDTGEAAARGQMPGFRVCPACGLRIMADLCPHHHMAYGEDWARSNRIVCDLLHRGIVPARLAVSEREDEWSWWSA